MDWREKLPAPTGGGEKIVSVKMNNDWGDNYKFLIGFNPKRGGMIVEKKYKPITSKPEGLIWYFSLISYCDFLFIKG